MINKEEIANLLVEARKKGEGFAQCPYEKPNNLEISYEIQNHAISIWPDEIAGWKIGRLAPIFQEQFGTQRLSGPIFKTLIHKNLDEIIDVNVFESGFAAVEAEYVFEISKDAAIDKFEYSHLEAFEFIKNIYAGVEMAGSPIFDINSYGPTIIASDFGNNFGLLLGGKIAEISDISQLSKENLQNYCAITYIDGVKIGEGGLFSMPDGPLAAIAWLLGHCALRGLPLKKGMLISTGAVTGVHDIVLGQNAKVEFNGPDGHINTFHIKTNKFMGLNK